MNLEAGMHRAECEFAYRIPFSAHTLEQQLW
jgi:hypothetical protein